METTRHNAVLREITLKDLWNIFVRRMGVMILAAVLAVAGVFAGVQLTYTPRYQSTATLYIISHDSEDSVSNVSTSFSLALKVVNDCDYLLRSHSVLDEVIEELALDMEYEELYKAVSTTNPEDTRILEVTVEAESPQLAKDIVDAICDIGPDSIREAMGFDQVNLYEYGVLNIEPSNAIGLMTYLLVGVIAAMVVYLVFLAAFLLDDRIRTEEDIQRYLGLSILGEMPNAAERGKKGYGYYREGSTPSGSRARTAEKSVGTAARSVKTDRQRKKTTAGKEKNS